jgi:N-acetylneuraminic acid mutarotase
MTYDPAMRRVVLFGGSRIGSDRNSQILGDLWSWDGSRWTQLAAATNAPMSGHRLFADGRGRLFLSGGRSGLTARWESGTWVRLGEDPNQSITASAAAFDPHRNRFVVFGGAPQPGLTNDDTWEFDGQRWTLVAQSGPPSLMLAAMAYDQAQRRILLFGGRDSAKRTLGDTWSWDGQTWSRLDVHGPLPRHGHAMAYDALRREVVMFGGTKQPRELLDETWLWNGRAWRKADGTAPPARSGAEMVFDASRGVIVLFGGASDDPVNATFGDTWEWNGRQWRLAHPGGSQTHYLPVLDRKSRAATCLASDASSKSDCAGGGPPTPAWRLAVAWAPRRSCRTRSRTRSDRAP